MKIFVTGGTGFIGRYTVAKLVKKGHKLLLLTRRPKKYADIGIIEGDLGQIKDWFSKVKNFKPDKALHLAWEGLPDYSYEMSKKNLLMSLGLYEHLASTGCKGIFTAGSCWEYGVQNKKLSEELAILPMNSFTSAKNALNSLGSELAKNSGMQFIWGRIFFAYGNGQRSTSLIPRLITYVRGREVPIIKDPGTKLDFIYAEDVADAITELIESKTVNGTYNIGSAKLTKVSKVVQIVGKAVNKESQFRKLIPAKKRSLASYHSGYFANISKIKKEVLWEPKTTITQGIQKMISSQ